MSHVLRDILINIDTNNERLLFLENLFKNQEIVIISSGPSFNYLNDNEIKYIFENYITICVKYVIEILLEKNITPTFFIYNSWLSKNNTEFYYNLSKSFTSIFGKSNEHSDNFNNLIRIYHDDTKSHEQNFELLKNNIDIITWKNFNNKKFYKNQHIMCELAIPLCIHLGVSKIYTVGWDLKNINNKYYCEYKINIDGFIEVDKINKTEYDYVPNIKKILNDKGIEIYKIKESPILLELKNIFK